MTRPDLSKLADFFKLGSPSFLKYFSLHKHRPLIFALVLVFTVLLMFGFSLLGLAVLRGRRMSEADPNGTRGYSLEGAKVVRDLYMPGPIVGETPFPLAFETDPGYTDEGLSERYNDMGRIDSSDLAARRKAELEAIYDALD